MVTDIAFKTTGPVDTQASDEDGVKVTVSSEVANNVEKCTCTESRHTAGEKENADFEY